MAQKLGQDGDQGVLNLNQIAGKTAGQLPYAALGEKRHGERNQSGVGIATQINQAALPCGGKRKGLEEGEARLHRQHAHQQERRSIRARHAAAAFGGVHAGVNDALLHNQRRVGDECFGFLSAEVFIVIRSLRAEQVRRARVFDEIVAGRTYVDNLLQQSDSERGL